MRFLNTTTLQFEQVPDSELQLDGSQYAILSHRWGADEDEVSYEDMLSSADISNKKGFAKIKGFCNVASSENCRYGWVDTCCINKANSSELSEAINSMYLWYSCSKICVVYLEDVPRKPMLDSEWFDRGWTLQELIAPKVVSFFDHHWAHLATKTEIIPSLLRKTRIPESVLSRATKPSACSVAQRMSWAAQRITKRVEDRAYSLMGLFNINMLMIYGERENAFLRLQQHIIQKSKDESIFAWSMRDTTGAYSGLYAPSPSAYIDCSEVVQTPDSLGFSEINGQLSIRLTDFPLSPGTYGAVLHCTDSPDSRICIVLARTSNVDEYVRVRGPRGYSRCWISSSSEESLISLTRHLRVPVEPSEPPLTIFYGFWLRTIQPPGHARCQITVLSNCEAPGADYVCQRKSSQGNTGMVRINPKDSSDTSKWSQIRWIRFGFTEYFNPVLWLANDSQSGGLQEPFERARQSGPQSQEHKKAMEEHPINVRKGVLDEELHWKWPEGRAMVEVSRERGIRDFVIEKLDLKISVQLQPFRSPTMAISGSKDGSGLSLRPMMVWVVDITETTEMRGEIRPLSANTWESGDRCWHCLDRSSCVCCGIISCCYCWEPCRLKMTWDEIWDPNRDQEFWFTPARRSYGRHARSRIPLLIAS